MENLKEKVKRIKFRRETEFKETEIGEIPRDWEVVKLGEVSQAIKGISYRTDEINANGEGGIFITLNNFLRGGGFKKEEFKFYAGNKAKETQKVNNGDLIIALTDMTSDAKVVGAPAIVFLPSGYEYGIISLDCAKLIPKTQLSNYYLYAYLCKSQEENATFANGVNVLHLDIKQFLKHKLIPLPPLDEQTRIATVLSWFDDLIENKKRQNEILEKTAMAIFKSWFIDFEPFKDEEFVYNEELEKEIPKGWEAKAIGEVFELAKGKKSNLIDEPIQDYLPYLLIENYKTGNYTYWTNEKSPLVDEFDIVIVADGESSGKIFRYQKGVLGSTLLALKQRDHNSDLRHYVYLTLKSTENELMEHRTGSAIPHLDKGFLKSLEILLPPESVLQRFHSLVEPLFQKIILNQKEIMILQKARNALLPELVFGRLRVEEI